MNAILVLGAGRSSSALINHLLDQAKQHQWTVTVGDVSPVAAQQRIGQAAHARAIAFDIHQPDATEIIRAHDIVVSLMPAHLHILVAKLCLSLGKHLLTASYVSPEMKALDAEARKQNLLLLNECGLDPGIDHMSAMQVIDRIRNSGGNLYSFESFTGGLIAPDTDPENPWRYKFTWNPRNVVMAGQGTARFLQEGQFKYIPYQQLFSRTTPVSVPGYGAYEGYANRDSLQYREVYGLQSIKTMLRGTLRNQGFCDAWNIFVQLGCCDDTYAMEAVSTMSHQDFINAFLDYHPDWSVEEKIAHRFRLAPDGAELRRLNWSGMFDATPVGLSQGTPAQILEHILNKRWKLDAHDRDLIVMWHRFRYHLNGKRHEIQASLIATGEDGNQTAMAKTVGWPLAIATGLLMQGKIKARGVQIPVTREFYEPILAELKTLGISLTEVEG
jgi:saccharopine dehydrogenase (NADP+, L-glutamate forming)